MELFNLFSMDTIYLETQLVTLASNDTTLITFLKRVLPSNYRTHIIEHLR